ncbi:MAG: DNA-3-methyladenine glycosylase I [Oleiphilaceae bacterium]|jgi:DNA-3-methyladenine glycosylase I
MTDLSNENNIQGQRCPWCSNDALYQDYHDHVWGRPRYDSKDLFAKLCLDGQQAGLSWLTILKKERSYYAAYDDFQPEKIINYDQAKIDQLLLNSGVVRNKLKVQSIIRNAKGFIEIEKDHASFAEYIWSFVEGKPIQNARETMSEVPVSTAESEAMSKALKKYGFNFVGPTICYAFMQAVGMVNDHLTNCPQFKVCAGSE